MKIVRKTILLLCCAVVLFSGVQITLASTKLPTLRYDGNSEVFTCLDTENNDLFPEFKEMIPGDFRTQEITLEATNIDSSTAVFLRAQCREPDWEILHPIGLRVYCDNALLSDGAIVEPDALSENIKIAEFSKAGKVKLKAELTVPTSVGNELADAEKHIEWIFTVQENGKEVEVGAPKTGIAPKTGLWRAVVCVAAVVLLLTLKLRKR